MSGIDDAVCMCCVALNLHFYICIYAVCAVRMKKRSGVGSRLISRRRWWWPTTSKWRLNRSCVHSGGSCRRSRIVVQSFPQTSRPCRESGTISTILHFFSAYPSTKPSPTLHSSFLVSGCSPFLSEPQCGYEIPARVLPYPHPVSCFTYMVQIIILSFQFQRNSCLRSFQNSYLGST